MIGIRPDQLDFTFYITPPPLFFVTIYMYQLHNRYPAFFTKIPQLNQANAEPAPK